MVLTSKLMISSSNLDTLTMCVCKKTLPIPNFGKLAKKQKTTVLVPYREIGMSYEPCLINSKVAAIGTKTNTK